MAYKITSDKKKMTKLKTSLQRQNYECPCRVVGRNMRTRFLNKCFCKKLRYDETCTCKLFETTDVVTNEDLDREADFFIWLITKQFGAEFVKKDEQDAGNVYLANFICFYLIDLLEAKHKVIDDRYIIKYGNLILLGWDLEEVKDIQVEEKKED